MKYLSNKHINIQTDKCLYIYIYTIICKVIFYVRALTLKVEVVNIVVPLMNKIYILAKTKNEFYFFLLDKWLILITIRMNQNLNIYIKIKR